MTVEKLIFYAFASVLILSALAVIGLRHSVKAVLSLVVTFFSAAALWLMTQAEFLAVSLVLVYVGAVLVLFLFVVMMLDVDFAAMKEGFAKTLPFGVAGAVLFMVALYQLYHTDFFKNTTVAPVPENYSNVRALGDVLYTQYFIAFELAAVILLVAMVAAISLCFRGVRQRKVQDVGEQVRVRKEERLKIVRMPAEKRESMQEDAQ
ncbi:MAG: NADH-quinone oxidoreductase subunit J [Gammaproteobacteria bacterium]|nr:MAG: NADH-quinone oxidoreductase subunit J [Gammaproteobacteria bacterium]